MPFLVIAVEHTIDVFNPLATLYPEKGSYMVTATVRDDDGAIGQASLIVQVDNVAPGARATASASRVLGDESITFDASLSTDTPSDLATLRYEWDLGGGKVVQGMTVAWSWPDAGHRTVILTVTDDDGVSSNAYLPIEVVNKVPSAFAVASPTEATSGQKVTFSAAQLSDTPSDLRNLTIIWDMGDGTILVGANVTHAFGAPGDHLVKLTVKDPEGAQVERMVTVTVTQVRGLLSGPMVMVAAGAVVALVVIIVLVLFILRRRGPGTDQGEVVTEAPDKSRPGPGDG